MNNVNFGTYYTKKLSDIWEDDTEFYSDWNQLAPFRGCFLNEKTSIKKIYWLLMGNYCNSSIANMDESQFKIKLWSIVYQYGPTWEKRLEYQDKLRSMTIADLQRGSASIQNHSFNPSTAPSTGSTTELETIDNQNTNTLKRGVMEAIMQANSYLQEDFTKSFLDRFRKLFIAIVEPQDALLYENE